MGRHSAGQRGPFYRSFVAWLLPWILIAAVVGAAVWLVVMTLGGEEAVDPLPTAGATRSPRASPTPTETKVVVASPKPRPTRSPRLKKTKAPKPRELITEGINIQVLNSTADTLVDDQLAARLSGLGFRIEAIDDANRPYERTIVYWSYAEAETAAVRLAERFGWDVAPKPVNLSTTVALHVVVGQDQL